MSTDDFISFYEDRFNDTEPDPIERLSRTQRLVYKLYATFSQSHSRSRFIEQMMFKQKRVLKRPPIILDAGCGGGSQITAKLGCVMGIDLALKGLKNAVTLAGYDGAVVGHVVSLPFANSSFDCVISRDLIGHLPIAVKNSFYKEMKRVCRSGGILIHAVEVESNNILIQWARKYPQLYRESFVLQDGHVGLEAPTVARERFESLGFRLVEAKPLFRTGILRAETYLHFFNGYRRKSVYMDWVIRLAEFSERHTILRAGWSFIAGIIDSVVGRFLPFDYAQLLLVCFENIKSDAKHSQ